MPEGSYFDSYPFDELDEKIREVFIKERLWIDWSLLTDALSAAKAHSNGKFKKEEPLLP